ncbi:MAG: sugar ABC transporter permease [Clostridia bacterium]|nr:sugar ABC transporter permease [Clostridia bacterium]
MKDNTKKRKKIGAKNETIFLVSILAYPMLLFAIFYLGVNFNSILLAFQKIDVDYNYHFAGFENFAKVFADLAGDATLRMAVGNSIKIFFLTLGIGMPLEILFSFYLFKKNMAHKTIRFMVMLPSIVSGMIMCLIFKRFVEQALPNMMTLLFGTEIPNLLSNKDTVFGTVVFYMLWTGFSSSLILYPNAMNGINNSVIESAHMDGCNNFQELWYIVLPLILPTITTFVVTGISGILMLSGPLLAFWYYDAPIETYTSGYYLFALVMRTGSTVHNYPYASAIGIVFTLFTIPVTFLVKYLLERLDPTIEKVK